MDISMTVVEKPSNESTQEKVVEEQKQPSLVATEINDENTALNVMVSFLYSAQKRGAFNLQESSKNWECIQLFTKKE